MPSAFACVSSSVSLCQQQTHLSFFFKANATISFALCFVAVVVFPIPPVLTCFHFTMCIIFNCSLVLKAC